MAGLDGGCVRDFCLSDAVLEHDGSTDGDVPGERGGAIVGAVNYLT